MKIIILSFIFVLLELFALIQLINNLKDIKLYTYETTATIDFIGLPDGIIFVSCHDENNILNKDVKIKNKVIQGKLDYVESFYGKEISIRLDSENNVALWLSVYYRLWGFVIGMPLIYVAIILLFYQKLKRKSTANSDLSRNCIDK